MSRPVYYLPITDPDVLLECCETLLRTIIERIIERYNDRSNYTDNPGSARVKIIKLEIDFTSLMTSLSSLITFYFLGIISTVISAVAYLWFGDVNLFSLLRCVLGDFNCNCKDHTFK